MKKYVPLFFLLQFIPFAILAQQKEKATQKPTKSLLKVGHRYQMKYDGHIEIWSTVYAMMDSTNIAYKGMEIFFDGKTIYKDTLNNHLAFDKPNYEIKKLDENIYEIFAGENHRPFDIRTTYFRIKNGKLIHKETLPTFFNASFDLDNDGKKELAGVLYDAIDLPNPPGSVWYWPILYYEETENGLALDSTLTIKENKKIYGAFHGFKNNQKIILPVYEKFAEEVKQLSAIR